MNYTEKILHQSNYWYNDGLRKAQIRDMSGAITSLRKSLQYNRANIDARNLLGLVYYGRGEVAEGLVEWIISKNLKPKDNLADRFIDEVQKSAKKLEQINQAVKKYNQCLIYCEQQGEDLAIIQLKKVIAAHPTFLKAYQLLALLYLKTEQYTAARQVLRTAHKLDTTDDFTLRYMHELNQIRKNRTVKVRENEKKDQQTVTYNIGNETIIQPVSTNFKEHTGLHTVINMLIGLVVGVAVMWFLVMPAVNSSRQKELNKQTVEFSDQIATQDAQISALKKELEEYRSTSEESENAKATGESTQESYEIVMTIYKHYSDSDMSNAAMVEELIKVNPDSLGTIGLERYNEMTEKLYPKQCEKIYSEAKDNFDAENYKDAITKLTQVLQMDEGYGDGAAKLLLAQSYEKSGDKDQANALYQKLVEDYKDTDIATSAQAALDAQNAKEDE